MAAAKALTKSSLARSGILLAVASLVANLLGYAFTLVLSRALHPGDFGAVGALINLTVIGAVPALAIQLVAARATAQSMPSAVGRPDETFDRDGSPSDDDRLRTLHGAVIKLSLKVGALLCLVVVACAPLLAGFLHLDGATPAVLLGVVLLASTVTFAAQGMLQGEERFGALSALFLTTAGTRFVGGALAGAMSWGPTGVMAATSMAALLAAAVAVRLVPSLRGQASGSRPVAALQGGLLREVVASTVSTAGLLILFNIDVLLARHYLPSDISGFYAVGALFAKAAFWGPQFLATLLYPRMTSREHRRAAVLRGVGLTAAMGVGLVSVTTLAAEPAVRIVAGAQYVGLAPDIWVFTCLGALLAIVQLLVYARLAVADRRLGVAAWVVTASVCVVVATGLHGSVTDVAGTALTGAALLALFGAALEIRTSAEPDPRAQEMLGLRTHGEAS